ncbi:MAG: hypothetical protein QMD85_04725, partial [Candidatus Aenigmarchaeota archaeon]|nr:hypothetical protein [Candidatus Aenigmarchaeota archaeon]MDI6722867.1 hypothetical protein [Candidatus Aenigmarchaeota archaeon]
MLKGRTGLAKGFIATGVLFVIFAFIFISVSYVLPVFAGTLTSTNVQPLSLVAGANTTVDVNFTTATSIPANGKVTVTFPSAFSVAGGVGWCNLTGTFSTTFDGQTVVITRNADGSDTVAITPVWCTVNYTINPRVTGSTGTYSIITRDGDDGSLDSDTSVSADTITAGALTSANVQPIFLFAGANSTADINFTVVNPIPGNGKI